MSQLLPDTDVAQGVTDLTAVNDRLAQIQRNFQAANDLLGGLSQPIDITRLAASLAAMLVKPGMISLTAGATADTGWLLCNGASYLRTDWPDLFTRIGGVSSPWGLPDGTHFNVPDFRSRLPVGVGVGLGQDASGVGLPSGAALTNRALAAWTGDETHLLSLAEMPLHDHTQHALTAYAAGGAVLAGGANFGYTTAAGSKTGTNGSSNGHNNVPPVMAINFQIKT